MKIKGSPFSLLMSDPHDRVLLPTNKGSKMTATVGSQFTTAKSGVTGTIQEIIKNDNGSSRVRLDVDGQVRWTTVKGA
jgi:hypothetical protein